MLAFVRPNWLGLRNIFSSIFTIVICPTMNFRNLAGPVSMTRVDRRGPFQCVCTPWIGIGHLSSFENRIEEIEHKHQLNSKYYDGNDGDHFIETTEIIERLPYAFIK